MYLGDLLEHTEKIINILHFSSTTNQPVQCTRKFYGEYFTTSTYIRKYSVEHHKELLELAILIHYDEVTSFVGSNFSWAFQHSKHSSSETFMFQKLLVVYKNFLIFYIVYLLHNFNAHGKLFFVDFKALEFIYNYISSITVDFWVEPQSPLYVVSTCWF